MAGKFQSDSGSGPISCSEFDGMLADALDGALNGEQLEEFNAHAAACQVCGASFAEAREGLRWLHALGQAEPPSHLVHNVLARTSHAEPLSQTVPAAAQSQGRSFEGLRRVLSGWMQPRFATTFGMAFFSLSLMFNMAGFRPSGLRPLDLSPLATYRLLSREYYAVSARLVRYYENTRFVYEMEFKVQELREAAGEDQEDSKPKKISVPQDTSRNRTPENPSGPNRSEEMAVASNLVPFPPATSTVFSRYEPALPGMWREPRHAFVAEVAFRRIA